MSKTIYVIKLVNNKYFIGSTYNLSTELKDIFTKKNTNKHNWLKQYEPLYVHDIIHNCHHDEEHIYLLKYIRLYGIENVRGSTFDSFTHEQESLNEIIRNLE